MKNPPESALETFILHSAYLTVDFDRSIEELVEAGDYDDVKSADFTSENFPSQRSGMEEVKMFPLTTRDLFGEYRRATSEEVIEAMKPEFKPAGLRSLLTFGIELPEEQWKGPIIDLGTTWISSAGDRYVPRLRVLAGNRRLDLRCRIGLWRAGNRFLAVRAEDL